MAQVKKRQKLPAGWTEEKVKSIIDYYDNQSEQDAIREAEEVFGDDRCTVMEIPVSLVDKVRALIERAKKNKHPKPA